MEQNILPTKGIALKLIKGTGTGTKVALAGISEIFNNAKVPAFVTDIEFEDSDVILPVVALDDRRVLYSFGKNFGKVFISGMIYFFNCEDVTDVPKNLFDAFNQVRSSAKLTPAILSLPGGITGIKVYPISLKFSNTDSKFQYMTFTIACIIAPITNKKQEGGS